MVKNIFNEKLQHYNYWWACLPAIPPDPLVSDWWAKPDGRGTPYQRIKRCWNDTTWFKGRRTDSIRPHEFGKAHTGMHNLVQIWENFTLFHPNQWVHGFLELAGLSVDTKISDACWSYEFEDSGKISDLTIHLRDDNKKDILIVVEAKWFKDKLKTEKNVKVGLPDTNPLAYISLKEYSDIADRRMVYLVEKAKRESTLKNVNEGAPNDSCPWGVFCWDDIVKLQIRLLKDIFPSNIAEVLSESVLHQGVMMGIIDKTENLNIESLIGKIEHLLNLDSDELHVQNYLSGASLFWKCRQSSDGVVLPFEYLNEEPSFQDLLHLMRARKTKKQKNPFIKQNTHPFWRLGPS